MGLESDLLADVQRRARFRRLIGRRLIDQKPKASKALQTGDIARLGEMRDAHSILGKNFDTIPMFVHRQLGCNGLIREWRKLLTDLSQLWRSTFVAFRITPFPPKRRGHVGFAVISTIVGSGALIAAPKR
ncbi:hypothetical protein [uncultured Rhodoblastus sp.]|uniref:hypothetical protein n=1 Tax=uncultured Rhodoblastus sp. TaxID=543037 RepID=UPI0025EDF775|nr:hypothetical protein [uncultured Rhodoblastus sp.]